MKRGRQSIVSGHIARRLHEQLSDDVVRYAHHTLSNGLTWRLRLGGRSGVLSVSLPFPSYGGPRFTRSSRVKDPLDERKLSMRVEWLRVPMHHESTRQRAAERVDAYVNTSGLDEGALIALTKAHPDRDIVYASMSVDDCAFWMRTFRVAIEETTE